jgi:hypothetical protein
VDWKVTFLDLFLSDMHKSSILHTEGCGLHSVTFTYNRPEYRVIYLASTQVYDTILQELCILAWSCVLVISIASKSGVFSVAQAGCGHLGPDWECTVDDGGPPNRTCAGSLVFIKVTF